jgi:Fic family protein
MPAFSHHDLSLLHPAFDSPLVDILTELEHLRRMELRGTTPAPVFSQLRYIFHMLESLGSARIEGNHTVLADYVESKLEGAQRKPSEPLREMENIENGMLYIEESIHPGAALTEHFIRELHLIAMNNLQREGDAAPGAYRQTQVRIAESGQLRPEAAQVPRYMRELVAFINADHPQKYDLIKVALAHSRFAWIHPFDDGNGRVVRMMTCALMIKYGFNVKTGCRVLNPTAAFYNDRDRYHAMLARADAGTRQGVEDWCVYVLQGILHELRKVDRLADFRYLGERILAPALAHARERRLITPREATVLQIAAKQGIAKADDLAAGMRDMSPGQRTHQIKTLVQRNMLRAIREGARQYTIGFSNSHLIRGIMRALSDEGFIHASLGKADR